MSIEEIRLHASEEAAQKESENRVQRIQETGMEPQCITSIQNNWFVGAKIIMDQIFDCMRQKKKARIVFDYDPQGGKTKITSYYHSQEK